MRRFNYFMILCLVIPNITAAQSAFLANPDIVWAAEIEYDWKVDFTNVWDEYYEGITTLKLLRTEQNEPYWDYPHLSYLVHEAAKSKKLPIFKDPECSLPLEIYDAYPAKGIDSTSTDSFQTAYWAGDVKRWRLRQILYYHKKKATWGMKVVAVAPLVHINKQDSTSALIPMFWFKADEKPQKLSSNHIVWAKETFNRQGEAKVPSLPSKVLKLGNDIRNPVEHLWDRVKNNPKTIVYGPDKTTPLTHQACLALMASRLDTILTFDPETYEEMIVAVQNDLTPDNITQLRLVHHWYWDERLGRLSVTLESVGLLLDVYNTTGQYRGARLLYYRRAK